MPSDTDHSKHQWNPTEMDIYNLLNQNGSHIVLHV